jgi:uncharacterized membrane protein
MTATEIVLLIIATVIVSFFLGYQFAKMRYMVRETMEMLKILNLFIRGEITPEEAKKQINELLPDL